MSFPTQRRLRLPGLDRQVARGSMQICHKIVMQQLYISRLDTVKQWVVISNPSDEPIDLTGYAVANADASKVFRFPSKYILLAGDEVTIWCSPGSIDLDTDNLLQPYLFWTRPDGSLRNAPLFDRHQINEIVLLDPFMIEVASLRISEDGKKEFRVLHCVSSHQQTSSSKNETKFCIGCLAPPRFARRTEETRDVYVFSRYWNVVSDKSLFAHFAAVIGSPLLECFRVLLIYVLLAIYYQPNLQFKPGGRDHLVVILLLMVACDVSARRLSLYIKSGFLVSLMSLVSTLLDQVATIAIYRALERLYPNLRASTRYLLTFDLLQATVHIAAVQLGFLEYRRQWHPFFKALARWDYQWQQIVFVCSFGRELLLYVLVLLPMPGRARFALTVLSHLLVPLFTFATVLDFLRGAPMLVYICRYPLLHHRDSLSKKRA